jgi:hypothetical protein
MGSENRMEESGMTTVITKDDVWALIDRLIEERGPDYVYEKQDESAPSACVYAWDGKPSCAVGQMVYYLKPEPQTIEFMVEMDAAFAGESGWSDMRQKFEEHLEVHFTEEAHWLLSGFQGMQDSSWRYGDIVSQLEREHRR